MTGPSAGSGSMSEILAAALQENGIAKVIGTKTAGAVAAGVPVPLADGSGMLVTVQMINTPKGRVLNDGGLDPDQVVELDPDQYRAGHDTQLDAAVSYVKDQVAARANNPGLPHDIAVLPRYHGAVLSRSGRNNGSDRRLEASCDSPFGIS